MEKGGAVEAKLDRRRHAGARPQGGVPAPNLRFAYAHLQAYEARRGAWGALK